MVRPPVKEKLALKNLGPQPQRGFGNLHDFSEIGAFAGADGHPLQYTVQELRQLMNIAVWRQFAAQLPLLEKMSERLFLHRVPRLHGIGDIG